VVNFNTVACRISSRLKRYKNDIYSKINCHVFFWFTVYRVVIDLQTFLSVGKIEIGSRSFRRKEEISKRNESVRTLIITIAPEG